MSSSSLKHQLSRLALRHQSFRPMLRHQAWLTTHVRNFKDLTGWICSFDRSSWLGLSIPSGIVGPSKRSIGLVCLFHLVLWKKENFSLLIPNGVHLGPNGVIPNKLCVCPRRPKGLECGNDTWRKAPHICH